FMIDISGSMLEKTSSTGPTKWAAVSQAIVSFFNDPQSAGISVGLQYFPLRKAGVPATCTSDAECGTGAPCYFTTSYFRTSPKCTRNPPLIPCSAQTPGYGCYPGWSCVPIGQCSLDSTGLCIGVGYNIGGSCGMCNTLSPTGCFNLSSCTPGDYAVPALPISL